MWQVSLDGQTGASEESSVSRRWTEMRSVHVCVSSLINLPVPKMGGLEI
jgi:hypothetical protein